VKQAADIIFASDAYPLNVLQLPLHKLLGVGYVAAAVTCWTLRVPFLPSTIHRNSTWLPSMSTKALGSGTVFSGALNFLFTALFHSRIKEDF
jgi:hypothetical protein